MLSRVFSTRAGAIVVALLLAAVAVAVVVIYAGNYRSSVKDSGSQVPVLVATRQIDQFTPGTQVVDGSMFRTQTVPADSRVDGAVTNPGQLKGLVARSDIYPGEQLTTNQFEKSSTTNVAVKLKPNQRAISFPVEPASGLIGQVQAGDHVDVVASFNVVPLGPDGLPLTGGQPIALTRTIVSNALVLAAPAVSSSTGVSASSSSSGEVLTLAINTIDVNHVLFAQDKGDIWFALRPPGSAANVGTNVVDVDSVLRGVPSARQNVLRLTGANR